MATLSALRTKVANNVGGRSDKNTQIDQYLNQAQSDLAEKFNWNDLRYTDSSTTLSAAGYTVSIPTTVRTIKKVRLKDANDNWCDPKLISKTLFRDIYPKSVPDITGQPNDCFIEAQTIYFSSLSDLLYTVYLDCEIYATDMSGDSSTPSILGVDDILVMLATGYLYVHLKQPQVAEYWFQLASTKMSGKTEEVYGKCVDHLDPH
jgi:hypothetical protein